MTGAVTGLSVDEQATLNALVAQLDAKTPRNLMRSAYMDMQRALQGVSPQTAPYLQGLRPALGWPAKAVDAVARRTRLEGFSIAGGDLSELGLDVLLDGNRYLSEVRLTHTASLTHAVSWEVVTRGGDGEPAAVVTAKSALDGTGQWNKRTRRLDSFLSVVDRDVQGRPSEFNLYLPGETIIVADGRVQDRSSHPLWVPVEPVIYKPRLDRPFGQSRITRAVIYLTNAAMRALTRMEGTADFYGTPHVIILGAILEQMQRSDGSVVSPWSFVASAVNGIPDDETAQTPRADIRQIAQGSQQPHLDTIDTIAAAFAGETNIPVSSLGVGVKQANPTSSESYIAASAEAIAESEDTADGWGFAHVRTLQNAWLMANGARVLPAELLRLRPVWRDPRQVSRAAAADASLKLVQAYPRLAESDAMLETVGLPSELVERIKADLAKQSARAEIAALGAAGDMQPQAQTKSSDELKAAFDALGVAVRAGVDPSDAAARLGLAGVRFTGAVPVSLRLPDGQAAVLEDK